MAAGVQRNASNLTASIGLLEESEALVLTQGRVKRTVLLGWNSHRRFLPPVSEAARRPCPRGCHQSRASLTRPRRSQHQPGSHPLSQSPATQQPSARTRHLPAALTLRRRRTPHWHAVVVPARATRPHSRTQGTQWCQRPAPPRRAGSAADESSAPRNLSKIANVKQIWCAPDLIPN